MGKFAILAALAISSQSLVAAQATTTFNAAQGVLSFNSAKEKRGSNALSSLLTQPTTGGSSGDNIGENLVPGDYVDYYGIATISGEQIDARVTIVSENGTANSDGADGVVEKLDDATSTTSANPRIRTDVEWNSTNGGQDWYVEFRIDFIKTLQVLQ
jgi:hypothetical protein